MIVVRMVMNVLPQKRLEFTQMIGSLMKTIRKEPGCLCNVFLTDIKDPNCFNMLEEWESLTVLTNHIHSDQFRVLLGSKPLLSQPLDIKLYTVSKTEGIEFATEPRQR